MYSDVIEIQGVLLTTFLRKMQKMKSKLFLSLVYGLRRNGMIRHRFVGNKNLKPTQYIKLNKLAKCDKLCAAADTPSCNALDELLS